MPVGRQFEQPEGMSGGSGIEYHYLVRARHEVSHKALESRHLLGAGRVEVFFHRGFYFIAQVFDGFEDALAVFFQRFFLVYAGGIQVGLSL